MQGRDYVDRILLYADPAPTESAFLAAIAALPLDKHDIAGMIFIAKEGLEEIDEDDPYHEALTRVVGFERKNKLYDRHDAKGILGLCRAAVETEVEPAPAP